MNPDTPLEMAVRHIDHMVEHAGIDCVGLGSDFDGATVPTEIGDAAGLPRLIEAMRGHGYSHQEIEKIAFGNWLSVLERTWEG
jgi:membrane dipeptidase